MRKTLESKVNEEYEEEKAKYLKWLEQLFKETMRDGVNSKEKIRTMVSQEISRVKNDERRDEIVGIERE